MRLSMRAIASPTQTCTPDAKATWRLCSPDIEPVWIGECSGIAVGSCYGERDKCPSRNIDASQRDRCRRLAIAQLHETIEV